MSRLAMTGPTACRGATLIEVAVSLLLISIGTLGLAGLQVSAKGMGVLALQRGQAAVLATSMLERIRANRSVLPDYASSGLGAGAGAPLGQPAVDCSLLACSPAQLSSWDLFQWQRALDGATTSGSAGGLANAAGCISVSKGLVAVDVAWTDLHALPDPNESSFCGVGSGEHVGGRRQLRLVSFVAGD